MATTLRAQLLGMPRVWLDNEIVQFPFKQAEALFYYLLVEQEVSKEVLAEVIWESSNDTEKALSSMRNAIYVLRKQFGRDILVEPVKSSVQINPALRPTCDIDLLFSQTPLPPKFYQGHFMEGFYLKKSPLYNEWLESKQRELLHLYIERCTAQIAHCLAQGELELCEQHCEALLRVDSYDDAAYLSLMDCYRLQKQYRKAIAVYERLETIYREELFEEPGPELQERVRQIKACVHISKQTPWDGQPKQEAATPLFGRAKELDSVYAALERNFTSGKTSCLLLSGEAGVGKTRLTEEVQTQLERDGSVIFLSTPCFRVEIKYALRPWQSILYALRQRGEGGGNPPPEATRADAGGAIQYANIEMEFASLLQELGQSYKIVLCFDDFQWADEATIALIQRLAADRGIHVFFLLLLQEGTMKKPYLQDFFSQMKYSGRMEMLTLPRLDMANTAQMAHSLLPDHPFTEQEEDQFYWETEGNPLFIVELANSIRCGGAIHDISPSIQELIKIRISSVPPPYTSLLELLSLFYSGASFEMLKDLSQKKDMELVQELEYLMECKFLQEATFTGESLYKFTHHKIPEYIYTNMSQAKRRVFHRKAGQYYEKQFSQNRDSFSLYTYLIHHYERAGMRDKALEHTVNYLHSYLGMGHEYFPLINASALSAQARQTAPRVNVQDLGIHITMEEISALLNEFTGGLDADSDHWDSRTHQLISQCYLLISRYYIQNCRDREGMKYIFKLKQINHTTGNSDQVRNLLGAYKLQLYTYINRHYLKGLPGVLEDAFALLPLLDDPTETSVWLLMQGMCQVMLGQSESAVGNLERAIHMFRNSSDPILFSYNLAAAHAWLGEVQRHLFRHDAADAYYRQAIKNCESYHQIGSVAIFYTYAGMNAYDGKNPGCAGVYLSKAVEQYQKTTLFWGRSLAFSYCALLSADQSGPAEAAEYLQQAGRCIESFDNQYELGVLLRVKAQIRLRVECGELRDPSLSELLQEPAKNYIAQAQTILRGIYSPTDFAYLTDLLSASEPAKCQK